MNYKFLYNVNNWSTGTAGTNMIFVLQPHLMICTTNQHLDGEIHMVWNLLPLEYIYMRNYTWVIN